MPYFKLAAHSMHLLLQDYSLSAAFGAIGFSPVVIATAASGESDSVPIPVWAASILLGGVLALIGYLLQRSVSSLDAQLHALSAKVEAQGAAAAAALEARSKEQAAGLAELSKEHRAIVERLDREQQKLRERLMRVETRCALHGTLPVEE